MNYPNEKLYPVPELGGETGRALRACGLWLRLGFIGASATAVGLVLHGMRRQERNVYRPRDDKILSKVKHRMSDWLSEFF